VTAHHALAERFKKEVLSSWGHEPAMAFISATGMPVNDHIDEVWLERQHKSNPVGADAF